jgi:hypothetical protein
MLADGVLGDIPDDFGEEMTEVIATEYSQIPSNR